MAVGKNATCFLTYVLKNEYLPFSFSKMSLALGLIKLDFRMLSLIVAINHEEREILCEESNIHSSHRSAKSPDGKALSKHLEYLSIVIKPIRSKP